MTDINLVDGEKFALGTEQEQRPWQDAYRLMVEKFGNESGPRYFGRSVPRNDVLYKVRGKASYAANLSMPGMLHGRFVRSTHPYARISRVDISKALAVSGVRCILTAADIPDERLYVGTLIPDTPILAKDVVRHVGEPVVAIAADTLEAAQAAVNLVEVDYEPLTPILSPNDALDAGAPLLHPAREVSVFHPGGNLIANLQIASGDVDAALAAADVVVEGTYTNEPIEHCFLEPQAGISFFDPEGILTLFTSTQYPHYLHKQLSRVTGLPLEKLRVIQSVVGGAFGGKIDGTIEWVTCLMTIKTGRPVKTVLEYDEVFSATTKRHAMTIRHRLGATRDGRITALDIDVLADGGAYASYSLLVAGRCVVNAALPYDIANVRARMRTAYTNNMTAGTMRSIGVVKLSFATESQINKLAVRLGISPVAIRRMNAVEEGTKIITGQILHSVGFKKTLEAIDSIYEQRLRALQTESARPGVSRGLGVASMGYGIGYSGVRNPSTARLEVTPEGMVVANCGTPDIGPGSDTTLAQIAAEAVGIDIGRIRVVSGDSTKTDDSGPTSASRTTYFSGNAAYMAGKDFRNQFISALAEKLDVPPERIKLELDRVFVKDQSMSFEDACARLREATRKIKAYGVFNPDSVLDLTTFKGDPYPTYTFGTQMAEVEVDVETGKVQVTRYWAAQDAGRIVNPMGAEGQIEGGVVMGLGMALLERIVREGGYVRNAGMRDYMLPGAKDVPTDIKTIFVDSFDKTGPFGAKGIAEASLIPVPAAVAAGIFQAVGASLNALPMHAEAVFEKMEQSSGNR